MGWTDVRHPHETRRGGAIGPASERSDPPVGAVAGAAPTGRLEALLP